VLAKIFCSFICGIGLLFAPFRSNSFLPNDILLTSERESVTINNNDFQQNSINDEVTTKTIPMNPHLAALAILFLIIYLGYNFIKAW
jgi:hypothetical protein